MSLFYIYGIFFLIGTITPTVLALGGKSELAHIDSYPFNVAIFKGDTFLCTGALLSDTIVLTVSSCLRENDKYVEDNDLKVMVGSSSKNSKGKFHKVEKTFFQKKEETLWQRVSVVLLQLTEKVDLDSTRQEIDLYPARKKLPKIGAPVLLTGWSYDPDESGSKTYLQTVTAFIENIIECNKTFKGALSKQHICSDSGSDENFFTANLGDLMVADEKLVGICVLDSLQDKTSDFNIFLDISSVYDFIKNQIKNIVTADALNTIEQITKQNHPSASGRRKRSVDEEDEENEENQDSTAALNPAPLNLIYKREVENQETTEPLISTTTGLYEEHTDSSTYFTESYNEGTTEIFTSTYEPDETTIEASTLTTDGIENTETTEFYFTSTESVSETQESSTLGNENLSTVPIEESTIVPTTIPQ